MKVITEHVRQCDTPLTGVYQLPSINFGNIIFAKRVTVTISNIFHIYVQYY